MPWLGIPLEACIPSVWQWDLRYAAISELSLLRKETFLWMLTTYKFKHKLSGNTNMEVSSGILTVKTLHSISTHGGWLYVLVAIPPSQALCIQSWDQIFGAFPPSACKTHTRHMAAAAGQSLVLEEVHLTAGWGASLNFLCRRGSKKDWKMLQIVCSQ